MAAAFFTGCVFAVTWTVAAWSARSVSGGALGVIGAATALVFFSIHSGECRRLLGIAKREAAYEAERSIRPRRLGAHRGTLCL